MIRDPNTRYPYQPGFFADPVMFSFFTMPVIDSEHPALYVGYVTMNGFTIAQTKNGTREECEVWGFNGMQGRCRCRGTEARMTRVEIGTATLILGDAYEVRPTLGWFDVDCMDPQYEFDNSGGGAFRKARGASDQIVAEGLDQGFDHAIINPLLCGSVVVFCHNDQLPKLLTYLDGSFHRFVVNFWAKPNPSPHRNKHYLADTEPYIHAWNRGFAPVGDHHDMHRWISASSMPSKVFGHPTVKPEAVMAKIIHNVAGETVCDPFMGTGSTGVAAVHAGKRFVGIERNPAHFETACARVRAGAADIEAAA